MQFRENVDKELCTGADLQNDEPPILPTSSLVTKVSDCIILSCISRYWFLQFGSSSCSVYIGPLVVKDSAGYVIELT